MNIHVPPILWYEYGDGSFAGVPEFGADPYDMLAGIPEPERVRYQVSQFPCQLHTTHLRLNDDGSSTQVAVGTSGWWEELVLAMATARKPLTRYRLADAILIAATACERCMNALAWAYAVKQGEERAGYPEASDEYRHNNTSCRFCDGSAGPSS